MPGQPEKYVIDANVLIQAHRRFYGLDFCPGYWDSLIWHQAAGHICSIDKVRAELERGGDALWDWTRDSFGEGAFAETSERNVIGAYTNMLQWVMAQSQFQDSAKEEFQRVADGWLAAYAKATGYVLVTLEQYDPVVRRKIPLPNLCRAFDVPCVSPFDMLRRLDIKLTWTPPS